MTMTHASLFSGIGGFDLAAAWAGWTNVFNCEIDPFCRRVLKYHFPESEHCDGDWCRFQSLPCTVNPITTFSNNEIGLACMGVGYRNKQLQFEFI